MQQTLSEKEQRLLRIKEELEYRKRINPLAFHVLMPMQKRFAECTARFKAIWGGNRSGKTEPVADYVISKNLAKPRQKWWVVGETYQDSVAIQQAKIWSLVPRLDIKYGRYDEINGFTNRKLLFKNGSMITFKSYDQKREAFQSDDIDGIWNDEEPPVDIYKEQKMRLLDRAGEMIISMTSLKGVTELIDDLYSEANILEAQHAPLVGEVLPRVAEKNGMMFFFLWTTENPHINQDAVANELSLMTKQEKMARGHGIPINLTGKIYHFNKRIHTISWDDLPSHSPDDYCLQMVLDPHDRKPWALIWVAIHKTGSCYVVDEYPFGRNFNEILSDDKTYDDYVKVIKDKERYLAEFFGVVHKRILDPNFGNKTVQLAERQGGQAYTTPKKELLKRGLTFIDGIDALEAGHLKVREILDYRMNDNEITRQPELRVVDDCVNTITHLSRYSRKDIEAADGDVKDRVNVNEKYKDFSDCVRYFAMSNPRYFRPQVFVPRKGKTY